MLFERDDSENDVSDNSDDEPSDFGMLNPDLLNFNNDDSSNSETIGPVASSSVDDESLPLRVFYDVFPIK